MRGDRPDKPGLARFHAAQDRGDIWRVALEELRSGQKQSHWMWFVFPQIAGLGLSPTARFYAIWDAAEARAYLADPLLGPRLAACTEAVLAWAGQRDLDALFGPVDARKFRSSMTLFEAAGGPDCFARALDLFAGGERDRHTLAPLAEGSPQSGIGVS